MPGACRSEARPGGAAPRSACARPQPGARLARRSRTPVRRAPAPLSHRERGRRPSRRGRRLPPCGSISGPGKSLRERAGDSPTPAARAASGAARTPRVPRRPTAGSGRSPRSSGVRAGQRKLHPRPRLRRRRALRAAARDAHSFAHPGAAAVAGRLRASRTGCRPGRPRAAPCTSLRSAGPAARPCRRPPQPCRCTPRSLRAADRDPDSRGADRPPWRTRRCPPRQPRAPPGRSPRTRARGRG